VSDAEPKAIIRAIESQSERRETPCGAGTMVWHIWGNGPPLVLLHGGNGSWRHWIRTIPHFARHYRVVAGDLPGLGESAQGPQPDTQEGIARIVADGLDRVIGRDARYHIAGFSFGGMISGIVAAMHGTRVRSLTVNGPGGLGSHRRTFELVSVRDQVGEERVARHRINLQRLMIHDPAKIDALALELQEWHSARNRLRTPLLSRSMALAEALARVRTRVGAIYGEFDAPANPNVQERGALLRSIVPDINFRVIAGAGHWTAYEAPEEFNANLAEMLRAAE
jgi:pimeloyl-ACP methyl ester carboxylesterase